MSKLDNITKQQLEEIIRESKSFKQVVEKIGYNSNGSGGYTMVRRHLILLNIPHPKYVQSNSNRKCGFNEKYTMGEILIENSKYTSRARLKVRLVRDGYMKYKCNNCDIKEWNNKPISLQLEHKNGINNDNRIENLELLCPNCHSQTETYGGKNAKREKKKHLCKCGNTKQKRSKNCGDCAILNRKRKQEGNRPPYEQLLKDIKETNYTKTGETYGVSDNTIRNWIKSYETRGKNQTNSVINI